MLGILECSEALAVAIFRIAGSPKGNLAMRHSIRTLLGIVLLLQFAQLGAASAPQDTPFSQGLLFRIEGAGSIPSHVFGTIHSGDARVRELPSEVGDTFDHSKHFAMEVVLDASAIAETLTALVQTNGETLESVLGSSLYAKTVGALSQRGYPELVVRQFKPWAVVMLLSVPPAQGGVPMDMMLYQQALQQSKTVHGLESVTEQLGVFERLSRQEQLVLLEDTLANLHLLPDLFHALVEAYVRRDLEQLMELSQKAMSSIDRGLARRVEQQMVDNRNRRMAERMLPLLKKGDAFVAIGALHLPGHQGVLGLLQQRGYAVHRVY